MILVVTYDLMNYDRDYPEVFVAIKSCGDWIKPLFSTWLVDTRLTAKEVADRVAAATDSDDRLLVDRLTGNMWFKNLPTINQWLAGRTF